MNTLVSVVSVPGDVQASPVLSPESSTFMPGNGGIRIAFSAARSLLAPIRKAEKAGKSCLTMRA